MYEETLFSYLQLQIISGYLNSLWRTRQLWLAIVSKIFSLGQTVGLCNLSAAFDANFIRSISQLQRFPKPLELYKSKLKDYTTKS